LFVCLQDTYPILPDTLLIFEAAKIMVAALMAKSNPLLSVQPERQRLRPNFHNIQKFLFFTL